MRSLIRRLAVVTAMTAIAMPAHAAWYEAKSKHFIVYADESPQELRKYSDKLERFDQAVRLIRGMDDPALTDSGRVTIFVLPSADAIESLAGEGVRGFYITRASGSFAFVPRTTAFFLPGGGLRKAEEMLTPQEIFFHEYAHHLQLQNATDIVPTWLAEGFAEFFATADISDNGNVIIGKFPDYRWHGVHDRDDLPLDQMVGETYNRAKMTLEDEDTLYARGWLLTDYLALSDSRKGQLTQYLTGIEKGMTPLNSAKAAFGDLGQLQHDMDSYSGHLAEITIQAKVLSVGDIAIRPLDAGEAAIMDARIRSKAGVNEKTAPDVAAEAAKVAAEYPGSDAVESELAEAEYDAKDYAASDAAATKAIAANPNDVHALIYKGRAQVALAKAHPAGANWDAVRQWFIRANKIDTENPEALEQYYLSFVEAGQKPTSNAVDAILYAADLAPRDAQVRINAVGVLLGENRFADAQALMAPLAYQPHMPPEMHDIAEKIMTAIAAHDAKTAMTELKDAANKGADKNKKS